MKTPIVNFAKKYNKQNPIRLHVPGHKGDCLLGVENLDLTELDGADNLYLADGIIGKSEKNATALFNFYTYYSAEGSSLSIRAMLYLIKMYGIKTNVKPLVLATRNTHKSFLSAVALLDIEIQWLYNKCNSYLASNITSEELETYLQNCQTKPLAFYVTSPDYLGNIIDIKKISEVCHKYNVFLMVDNAHGCYLKFLQNSIHPIDLGADICCDSAHKTLPALTGAGYLHFSKSIPNFFLENVKQAMSIFGSTSPSYLIMQSLDLLNKKIDDKYKRQLNSTCSLINQLKLKLTSLGYTLVGNEPLKLTINVNNFGYTGNYLARILKQNNIYVEFYDKDYVVMMFGVNTNSKTIHYIYNILKKITKRNIKITESVINNYYIKKFTLRETLLKDKMLVDVDKSLGKVYAEFNLPCPPAVPIIMPGEIINKDAIESFKYYNIKSIKVLSD